VLPWLTAGYDLARWLTGDPADAEDVLHDAVERALRFFSVEVNDGRVWFLRIVRNRAYTVLGRRHDVEPVNDAIEDGAPLPDAELLRRATANALRQAITRLPAHYREVIVLGELEELPVRQVAEILQAPEGTVTSRLMRGRKLLAQRLRALNDEGVA
jgi:RNA polymerase sigma-70 factor (ECF subfamily)